MKDDIVQLKKKQDEAGEELETLSQIQEIDETFLSYLEQATFKKQKFYVSSIVKKEKKELFLKKFPKFKKSAFKVIKSLLK